jgi:hypothetical protein
VAVVKIVKESDLGTYMNYNGVELNKLNPVLPAINQTALATVPTLISNVNNRNEFVVDSKSEKWFIDYAGDGLNLGHKNGIYFFNALSIDFPAIAQTNTTRVPVTSWSIPVIAGKSYLIEILSTYRSVVATTGGSMGFTTSGGAVGTIRGYFEGDLSNTFTAAGFRAPLSAINTVGTTTNSFLTTTGTTLGQSQCFNARAVFNCTTGGSVIVNWGTEIANSRAWLEAGSSLIVTLLN